VSYLREINTPRGQSELVLKIAELRAELIKWVVGVGVAQVAMLVTLLRLFPSVPLK
jgi:hypothetical protein